MLKNYISVAFIIFSIAFDSFAASTSGPDPQLETLCKTLNTKALIAWDEYIKNKDNPVTGAGLSSSL